VELATKSLIPKWGTQRPTGGKAKMIGRKKEKKNLNCGKVNMDNVSVGGGGHCSRRELAGCAEGS